MANKTASKEESKPTIRKILDLVIPNVTQKWEQLGAKLLKNDQVAQLSTIRSNYPSDNETCCFNMFKYWLQTNPNASWEQLITELHSPGINFPNVAENLVKQLKGEPSLCHFKLTAKRKQRMRNDITSSGSDRRLMIQHLNENEDFIPPQPKKHKKMSKKTRAIKRTVKKYHYANPASKEVVPFSPDAEKCSSFEAPKNMMLADKFTLGYAHLAKELRECNNIHVAEAHMLVMQMSNRFGFKFPHTTPSTMDDFLKMLSTFSINNCFNPRLIDMLINYFNINCLKSFVPSLRETHSSVTVMEVVSTMPGEVEDIVVVQKDRHTRFQSDELTLLEVIGDEASVFASLENKTLYLHPAVRFHGNVIDVPSYILAYIYKYIADCSTEPLDFKVSRHLSTVYMHLGNYKIDLYNTHKENPLFQYFSLLMDNLNDTVTLSVEMEAKKLLTINQLNMIIAFMDDYMRVVYIFQHLCNISLHDLFTFLSLLTESDNNKHIGDILTKGLKLAGLSKSSDDAVTKNDESSYDIHNENTLSDVELQYFKLINKLTYLLSSKSVQFIIDILSSLMAHESSGIKLFPLRLIEMFRRCNTKSSLLQALFPYSSFCDYSIFEELLEKCFPEGVELPNNKIDLTKCISTYSILKPSPLIIPDTHSCFTLMATRHSPEFPWLQFKHIISIKSLLLNTFTLSKSACTLVAIGSTICYWRILKRIARYITDEIHKHLDCFKNQLLFNEIAIYRNDPEIIFSSKTAGDSVNTERYIWIGHLEKAVKTHVKTKLPATIEKNLRNIEYEVDDIQVCNQNDSDEKLKQDESELYTGFQMQEQRFKELEERYSLMLEDLEIKTKEEIEAQRSKLRDIRVELSDIFKTLNKDADHELPTKIKIADEEIIKGTTVKEYWQQLEYEIDDMQKLIEHLQLHAKRHIDENLQLQDEKQDLSKQLQNVCSQYDSVLEETKSLFTSLQIQKQRCKELEESYSLQLEDAEGETKERIAGRQRKLRDLKEALYKVIKSISRDAELPATADLEVTDERVINDTTVREYWQKLEYETDDMEKLIEQLQQHAFEAKMHVNDEKKVLSQKFQHVCRKFNSARGEIMQLKQDESRLLEYLKEKMQRVNELEKICSTMQEDMEEKAKERKRDDQKQVTDLKETLDHAIMTLSRNAELCIKTEVADADIYTFTLAVDNWQQLEYKANDIQKVIAQHQHRHQHQYHVNETKSHADEIAQQQKQSEEEVNELTIRLSIREKELAKAKEDNRLLVKRMSRLKESKQLEEKVDKDFLPVKHELLGSGNYGEVYKVQHKGKSYAGKVFYSKLLPGYPDVFTHKLVREFTLNSSLASKFSHRNVEQFVEITQSIDGVPMIITELLNENLTAYIKRTYETFHYDLQLSVCSEMAQGLQYLHSQQLVHGNLHGANILITHDHHAKIADYLCTLLLPAVAPDNLSVYLPPETVKDKKVSVKSNVFTLAVLFLEIVTKHPPQPSDDLSLSEMERRHTDLQKVPKCHPLLKHIQKCFNDDELIRPLMKEVCDHLADVLTDKDSPQAMAFKLIHTNEYPSLLPTLASGMYQLQYKRCQYLPLPLYWAYAVTIGMMVYVTGGNTRNGDAVEHVYRFDLERNQWKKLPPTMYHYCVPAVMEGKLSLIGGRKPSNNGVISNKVNTYNENSDQWVTIYPDMNQPRCRPAVVTSDSHVIVMGGKIRKHGKLTDSIEIMNLNDKQWITLATPLPKRMRDMSVTISNGLVWIIGYDNCGHCFNKVFTIPLAGLTNLANEKLPWTQLRNVGVCFRTAVIGYSNPPVILGGDDRQNNTVSAVVAFDPKTESWNDVAALSSPRAHCAVAKLPGERGILVIGGCTETKTSGKCNSSCLRTVEMYYVSKNIL